MVKRWGEGFALGGLGGLPFAGKSGFRAYLHHVPDSGELPLHVLTPTPTLTLTLALKALNP